MCFCTLPPARSRNRILRILFRRYRIVSDIVCRFLPLHHQHRQWRKYLFCYFPNCSGHNPFFRIGKLFSDIRPAPAKSRLHQLSAKFLRRIVRSGQKKYFRIFCNCRNRITGSSVGTHHFPVLPRQLQFRSQIGHTSDPGQNGELSVPVFSKPGTKAVTAGVPGTDHAGKAAVRAIHCITDRLGGNRHFPILRASLRKCFKQAPCPDNQVCFA